MRRGDVGLTCGTLVYMCCPSGVLFFELPYRFQGMYVLFVYPLII